MTRLPYYTAPSVKRLMEELQLTKEQAIEVRALLHGEKKPIEVPAVAAWVRNCYSYPKHIEQLLAALDVVCETFGVECISNRKFLFEFLNTGDVYNATLVYAKHSDSFFISTEGGIIESYERRGGGEFQNNANPYYGY